MGGHLPGNVRFVKADGLELDKHLPNGSFDIAFMSNYLRASAFERSRCRAVARDCDASTTERARCYLQPNVRLAGGHYWDFIDHHVALTERSLVAAGLAGFRAQRVVTRFLPYTTKTRMPQNPLLVRAYLKLRPAWVLFGKQTLYVGEKVVTAAAAVSE